jgi:hypothetical protein
LLVLLGSATPGVGRAQETVAELQELYRIAVGEYDVTVLEAERLETVFDGFALAFDSARAVGDAARLNQAFTRIQELTAQIDVQQERVEEKAAAVVDLRRRLLVALNDQLEDYRQQAATAENPSSLLAAVQNTELWISELRRAEEPVVTLEPAPNIVIRPTDDTASIRSKARFLDTHAEIKERQLAYNAQLLEELRREQALLRWSQDFRADRERFGDTSLPVGPPPIRPVQQTGLARRREGPDSLGATGTHLTYEERIAALEAVQALLSNRIQETRAKAELFRRLAGGVWA